jgi:hypothetical protein
MVKVFTSRYTTFDSIKRSHRGKPLQDLVNSKEWKSFLVDDLESYEYKVAIVPANMEFRADLIALAAFGSEKLWWLICTVNGIIDPMTELIAGKQIYIPIIR